MSRPLKRTLATVLLLSAIAGVGFGAKIYLAQRAWTGARPVLPAPVGDMAPGLDQRLAVCASKFKSWPPDQTALAEFAQLCHANGQLEPAVIAYRALMRLQPTEPRWPHLMALILAGDGRLDEALPALQRTTELAPDRVIAWLLLGDALLKLNRTKEAEAAYTEALRRESTNGYALLGLARCDLQGERWSSARSHLQQAVAQQANFTAAQSLLASVLERLGNPEGAAIARARSQRNGHYPEPPDAWHDALTDYCHDPYTLLVAASSAAAEGRPEQALSIIKRALLLAPSDARLHRKLGNTLMQLGDAAGARKSLEAAATLAPTNDAIQLNLIGALRHIGDQLALKQAVAQALVTCPASAGVHYEAGLLAREAGRFAEAADHFAFTWKNQPDQPAIGVALAEMHFRAGENDAGFAALQDVLTGHPAFEPAVVMLINRGIDTKDARTSSWLNHARESGVDAAVVATLEHNYQQGRSAALP